MRRNTQDNMDSNEAMDEFEQLLRNVSEVSGSNLEDSLRIVLAVIDGLGESLARIINNLPPPQPAPATFNWVPPAGSFAATVPPTPFAFDLFPALQPVATPPPFPAPPVVPLADPIGPFIPPFAVPPPLATMATPPETPRPASIGPIRTTGPIHAGAAVVFFAVVVGREIGVYQGPWRVFSLFQ